MDEAIQVLMNVESEQGFAMQFWMVDDGVKFSESFTLSDLQVASAVLLDLNDAIQHKMKLMKN